MATLWYALQTRALKESIVADHLNTRGVTVFYPSLHVKPVNPRSRTIRPFFPCYLFVKTDLSQVGLSTFQYLPNAVGLVHFGGEPAPIDAPLIAGIAEQLDRINIAGGETLSRLSAGDRVQIEHGPFAGYEAIFDGRLRDSERVRLLLELIGQRQVVVELAVNQIRPLR